MFPPSVFSPKDRETRKPRGFTFCQYRRKEDAADAVKGMDKRVGSLSLSLSLHRLWTSTVCSQCLACVLESGGRVSPGPSLWGQSTPVMLSRPPIGDCYDAIFRTVTVVGWGEGLFSAVADVGACCHGYTGFLAGGERYLRGRILGLNSIEGRVQQLV